MADDADEAPGHMDDIDVELPSTNLSRINHDHSTDQIALEFSEEDELTRTAAQDGLLRRTSDSGVHIGSYGNGIPYLFRQSALITGHCYNPDSEEWQQPQQQQEQQKPTDSVPAENVHHQESWELHGVPAESSATPLLGGNATCVARGDEGTAKASPRQQQSLAPVLICGLINSVVTIPVMMSFAAIIFQDPFFQPVLGQLVKLAFLSSAIHQTVFTWRSTLRFAVGQVQDVGLIFLSAIASSVVALCTADGQSFQKTLGTALLTLTLSTAVVGVFIILTGWLKLASLVQYVPLPVVGGYLGYVGFFCLSSGLALAAGVQLTDLVSWLRLGEPQSLVKITPAIASLLLLMYVLRRFRSPLALPAVLLAIPAAFYLVLLCLGVSRQQAQAAGWIASSPAESGTEGKFWRIWGLFNLQHGLGGIDWSAMPRQIPSVMALYFVVAFGSSMDVAAIQQEHPDKLDYNKELMTVGLSNLVTGMTGAGFTGSYIFSQTLFTMRNGVNSPLNGIIIASSELAVFVLPINIVEYLPSFFFGSLMIWIGFSIAKDWLVTSFGKLTLVEYLLLWATLGTIVALGLEIGIITGIVLASLLFAYNYARVVVTAFTVVPSRSGAVRTFAQRTALELFAQRVVAVSLSGYIFFGSSVTITDKVMEVARLGLLETEEGKKAREGMVHSYSETSLKPPRDLVGDAFEGSVRRRAFAALEMAPLFLLLDFRRVTGIDATAARTFATLRQGLAQLGIELLLTHLPESRPRIRALLQGHGIIGREGGGGDAGGPQCRWFQSMEAGLQHCEEAFLACAVKAGLCRPSEQHLSLAQILQAHLSVPRPLLPGQVRFEDAARRLMLFLDRRQLEPGEALFRQGDPPDEVAIMESGSILCELDFAHVPNRTRLERLAHQQGEPRSDYRILKYGPGGIVGELDFFLQRPRSFRAAAEERSSLLCLSRQAFESMVVEQPALMGLLQTIILRSTCLSASHALEALERSGQEM